MGQVCRPSAAGRIPSEMEIPTKLIQAIRGAGHVAVLTGAGISKESGIPTFREAQTGLWARYDPEELATPAAFRRNPRLVWEWYQWRRGLIANARPNPGHLALAGLARLFPEWTLITQNIDGLHKLAGSEDVIELHGNIHQDRCDREGKLVVAAESTDLPPRCPDCGALLRPDVVWFGESLPWDRLSAAYAAAASCDVFMTIGTSALVHPAASLPVEAARIGAVTIEINPAPTPISSLMRFRLIGPSGTVLPLLLEQLA